MSLDNILSEILISSVREKTASENASTKDNFEKVAASNLTTKDASSLIKISNLVRQVKVEPTYEDLYTFVGGLYGRR